MSRLNLFIIPPEDDGTPRCKFCFTPTPLDELSGGACDECYDALKARYQALIRENFEADEIDWLLERDEICCTCYEWLKEVAEG